jgi:hypothetical protein
MKYTEENFIALIGNRTPDPSAGGLNPNTLPTSHHDQILGMGVRGLYDEFAHFRLDLVMNKLRYKHPA